MDITTCAKLLGTMTVEEIEQDCTLGRQLIVDRFGNIEVLYAPFDHINKSARLVICGVTPGRQQAVAALLAFHRALKAGNDVVLAAEVAKLAASFVGPMRLNLARMFDYVGLNRWLGISGCDMLFAENADLVHYTSALRYPVFVDGSNYSGDPGILRVSLLKAYVERELASEVQVLTSAVWVPLGGPATAALLHLADAGLLPRERILDGFPHASGANSERIAYFCGRKSKANLSDRTRPDIIDVARASLVARIARLPS